MAYTFDMNDNNSVKKINNTRREICYLKENTASPAEKKVIAWAVIRFETHPTIISANILHGDYSEIEASNHCKIMEFHVSKELFKEVVKTGKQEEIEESIRQAFMRRLPSIEGGDDSIDRVKICMLPEGNFITFPDAIAAGYRWYEDLDLESEPTMPTEEKPKEESKPKEKEKVKSLPPSKPKEVFIVHGRDDDLKDLKLLLIEKMKVQPIVLRDTNTKSDTLIEALGKKIHPETDFVIVLITPDDFGRSKYEEEEEKPRARQNVIFEMGMALGAMDREKVFLIKRGDLEDPSDIKGIIYNEYKSEVKELSDEIRIALRDAGFNV